MIETTNGLAQEAKISKRWDADKVFAIKKIKETLENEELKNLLKDIIA